MRVAAALDRARVIETGLRLLDEVGLDGLTLRRLTQELGVQPAALYWHFVNKQDLLDHMAAHINESALAPHIRPRPGQNWEEWLTDRARSLRRACLSHRDGARLVAAARPTIDRRPSAEALLYALTTLGFTPPSALRAIRAVGHYVSGAVLQEEALAQAPTDPPGPFDAFPYLQAAIADQSPDHREAQFNYGLACVLAGIRASLHED
jgi:TetR/AcrR family tetracycline transcriptional repressor